jgi:hypothetical protein
MSSRKRQPKRQPKKSTTKSKSSGKKSKKIFSLVKTVQEHSQAWKSVHSRGLHEKRQETPELVDRDIQDGFITPEKQVRVATVCPGAPKKDVPNLADPQMFPRSPTRQEVRRVLFA